MWWCRSFPLFLVILFNLSSCAESVDGDTRTALAAGENGLENGPDGTNTDGDETPGGTPASSFCSDSDLALVFIQTFYVLNPIGIQLSGSAEILGDVYSINNRPEPGAISGSAHVSGTYFKNTGDQSPTITGGGSVGAIVETNLLPLKQTLNDLSRDMAMLSPTMTMPEITGTQTLTGNGGWNIINVEDRLFLTAGQVLTLSGTASDVFVINVKRNMVVASASIQVTGGVLPKNVLFNFYNYWGDFITISGSGSITGTILAPSRSVHVTGSGHIEGAIISGTCVLEVSGSGFVLNPEPFCPDGMPPTMPAP